MAIPSHNPGCHTRTFETRCLDCHQKVFFFSCSCESKVLFDKLGDPWPLHSERCIPYLIRVLRTDTGLSDKAILERVEEFATTRGLRVPKDIYGRLSEGRYSPRHKLEVMNIVPYEDTVIVEGMITEINLKINVCRRFDVVDSPIGRGMLGELGKGDWSEVTVRQMHTEIEQFAYQFAFLIPYSDLLALEWSQGRKVSARIRYFRPAGRSAVWFMDGVESS